jgi:hypothetical protein
MIHKALSERLAALKAQKDIGGWPRLQFGFELDLDCGWCETPTRSGPMFVPHGRTWGFLDFVSSVCCLA